jgi:hypothetical protein
MRAALIIASLMLTPAQSNLRGGAVRLSLEPGAGIEDVLRRLPGYYDVDPYDVQQDSIWEDPGEYIIRLPDFAERRDVERLLEEQTDVDWVEQMK